jgi:hypothetical protein
LPHFHRAPAVVHLFGVVAVVFPAAGVDRLRVSVSVSPLARASEARVMAHLLIM